jgi:hypothetical protein
MVFPFSVASASHGVGYSSTGIEALIASVYPGVSFSDTAISAIENVNSY